MNEIFNGREEKQDDGKHGQKDIYKFADDPMGVLFGFERVDLRLFDFGRLEMQRAFSGCGSVRKRTLVSSLSSFSTISPPILIEIVQKFVL